MGYTDTHIQVQRRATKALLKFCEDHHNDTTPVKALRSCLAHLEAGNVREAYRDYEKVPLGGMGCFNDWFPPAVFPHEDGEYAWAVFEALCAHWSLMMKLARR